MKYSRCDNANICTDSLSKMATASATTTNSATNNNISNFKMTMTMSPGTSSGFLSDLSPTPSSSNNNSVGTQFSDEFRTVESLYEKWSDCERTVVLYALLKRLRYPCLKFLQYSIDNNLTQHAVSQSTMNAVIADINANNPSYLQNLFNAYNTFHLGDIVEAFSSTSSSTSSSSTSSNASDKESMPCYGSAEFQLKPNTDERKLYAKKEDILHEVLNILPLLKPGNEDAKTIYLSLIPNAVKDTIKQIVPPELVQQIFSYLLIHPAVTSDDRRSLSVWLRQLEDFLHCSQRAASSFFMPSKPEFQSSNSSSINADSMMVTSVCSASSSCSSSSVASCNSNSVNANISLSGVANNLALTSSAQRNADWQTIAPPAKFKQHFQFQQQQQQQQPKVSSQLTDWCDALNRRRQSCGGLSTSMTDQLCDNFNGITLNELGSSHSNSLGLSSLVSGDSTASIDGKESSLVNGVAAAAASAEAAAASQSSLFGAVGVVVNVNSNNNIKLNTNPIINIIANSNSEELNTDDHDTSFSKNGTDLDFEPPGSNCNSCSSSIAQFPASKEPFGGPSQPYSSLFGNNIDQLDANRWSLDSKIAALKTRRSNSLTTQTISTSSSSSNSSVVTVNDNCSNSTENLAQFANKPRSFSLSIENQQRSALINGGSDTRLDDFKPNYIKFQTRNVGMSNIGTWLKSLRLHKYVELFYNLTYEDMLQISEEYLQNLGVTKGASHKLALCIEKLKERPTLLAKLEQDLMSGKQPISKAIEELTNLALTPMKPVESADNTGNKADGNIALLFLRTIELVCSNVQRDPYILSEDESLNSIVWILDRAIHSEAFINHINQLKELKFQISKLKIAFAPRLHYSKGNGGSTSFTVLNKTRWNSKPRKCDSKNGSNDRINYRKNSGDMLGFPSQQNSGEFPQQQTANNGVENNSQYKNSTFSNYMNQHTQQVQQQQQPQNSQQSQTQTQPQNQNQNQSQQPQYQSHIAQQQNHFPSLPQPTNHASQQQQQQSQHNGRSHSNLIVVTAGPQKSQKIVFKPGGGGGVGGGGHQQQQQGVLSMSNSIRASADNLQVEKVMHHHHQQQRKGSLASVLNSNNINFSSNNSSNKNGSLSASTNNFVSTTNTKSTNSSNSDSSSQQSSQQQIQQTPQTQQQQKKTMAAVVMVSSENQVPRIDIDGPILNDRVMNNSQQCRQQQSQPQKQQQQHSIAISSDQMFASLNSELIDSNNVSLNEQQLQLLAAAAAAAVASCCSLENENENNRAGHCLCSCSVHNNPKNFKDINNEKNKSSHNNNNSNNTNSKSCNKCSTYNGACNNLLPPIATSASIVKCVENNARNQSVLFNDETGSIENYEDRFIVVNNNVNKTSINDIRSLEQLETLCLQMTEQAIN